MVNLNEKRFAEEDVLFWHIFIECLPLTFRLDEHLAFAAVNETSPVIGTWQL